ncbi:MAG: FRG domain-containing protein [Phascolarctobacterium sp.]|nr:FRG domain-containing protein [Phascolarctobacterium sp.]
MYTSTISKYINKIEECSKFLMAENGITIPKIFYRGVNFPVELEDNVPKLFRQKYEFCFRNENKIVKDVINNRPNYFKGCKSTIECLEIMQHNGLPTRLLDITRNYLVALYFACLPRKVIDENGMETHQEEDGRIFVYGLDVKDVLFEDSDLVSTLANISLMPADFKAFTNERIDGDRKFSKEYIDLLNKIKAEHPWVDSVNKKWLDGYVVCVVPRKDNHRIVAQDGAFFLFGISGGIKNEPVRFSEKSNKHVWVQTVDIDKNDKERILEDLDMMGINEETLFPELEHYKAKIEREYGVKRC